MCEALLVAQTVDGYTSAMGNLMKFINENPKRKHLESWNEWREYIFNAFAVSVEAHKKGESSCGRGPSFAQRNYRREIDQATRYGREIEELRAGNTVDGKSGHRPPDKIRKKRKSKKSASSSVSFSQSHPGSNKTALKTTQSASLIQLGLAPKPTAPLASSFKFPITSSSESFQPNYCPSL